jgi:predicted RND superfamily exporter protein
MEKLSKLVIKLRWVTILTVLILSLFLGYQIKYLRINPDIISSLPDDDPIAKLYKDIGSEFGGNDIGIIILENENVFTVETLSHIRDLTDSIRYSKGVSSVISLTNVIDIKSSEYGIEIGNLIDEYNLPTDTTEIENIRKYIFSKDMYKESLVSADGTATAIIFTLESDVGKHDISEAIRDKVIGMNLPERLYFGGFPMMMSDLNNLIVSDISWLIPIVIAIIAAVLFLSFLSVSSVILPLLTAGLAVIWTMGIMSLCGYELTMISNTIPVVLLAIGSAYTIHVLNSLNNSNIKDKREAISKSLSYVIVPVTISALTTAVGFISFIFGSYLIMIKEFGIFTALGTAIALILSVLFVPAIISLFPQKKRRESKRKKRDSVSRFILERLISSQFKHPKRVLALSATVLLIAFGGLLLINTSVNMADYFRKDNETRVAEEIIQLKFGGSLPVFVVFEGDMQSPEVLKMMIKTEKFLKESSNIIIAQSVASLIEQMNDVMGEGKRIPDEREKIEQLWFLLDGQELMPQLVNDELNKGIIQSKLIDSDTRKIKEFTKEMNQFINENRSEDYSIVLTGIPSVYLKLNESIIESQFSSLLIAIIVVILIIGVILKSLSKGIMATIPIIITVFTLFGFMGIFGISLDIATVLIGSVALGIGIDYSVHIISGIDSHMKESDNIEEAVRKTIMMSGNAVIINIISVSAGFSVLCLSQLVPLQNFGLLVAISMFASGFGALTTLPVILILYNKKITKKQIK